MFLDENDDTTASDSTEEVTTPTEGAEVEAPAETEAPAEEAM